MVVEMVRPVITTIDSLANLILFRLGIRGHARPRRLGRDPVTRHLLLDLEADEPIFPNPALSVSFHLHRVFPISSPSEGASHD